MKKRKRRKRKLEINGKKDAETGKKTKKKK